MPLEQKAKWRFPGNGGTKKNGLDTTDFHTFMNDAAASLAREICQNSNDARDPDTKKPAVVEFHSFDMKTSEIPNVSELIEELKRCEEYWTGDNDDIVKRVKQMRKLLEAERIQVLRVSDFNTTGLIGVSDFSNEKSPWYSLMHGSGESGKSGSEGGSKGVGKYATFVNSLVRTVFYSTTSKQGESGYQGIAYFCSSKVKDSNIGELTQGIGYFGIDEKNDPISGEIVFDPHFSRKKGQFGTDIYIIGFDASKGWKQDIITKVLDSVMVAIVKGRLEVRVDDIEINAKTLGDIVFDSMLIRESLKKNVISQYILLSDDDTVIHKELSIEYDGKEVGKVDLYLKRFLDEQQKYATNGVAMVRYPFMKIKDRKGIVNAAMTCSALCIIPDGELMKRLKASENPEHTDWIANRIKDPADRAIMQALHDDLITKIQNTIIECLRTPDSETTDAAGASKYLPEYDKGKERPAEKGGKQVPKPIISKPTKKQTSEVNTYYEDPDGNGIGLDLVDETEPGESEGLFPEGHNETDGRDVSPGDNPKPGKKGKGGKEAFVRQHMKGITFHFFCVNKKRGEYGLTFSAPRDVEKAECIINMVDESGAPTPIKILEAKLGNEPVVVKDEKKILFSMREGDRIALRITTDIKELFSAEVHLYATR